MASVVDDPVSLSCVEMKLLSGVGNVLGQKTNLGGALRNEEAFVKDVNDDLEAA